MQTITGFVAGLLFGAGLGVARLFEPASIIGVVNVFGAWDPSLIVAMAAAAPTFGVMRMVARRGRAPWLDTAFHDPTRKRIDRRLVIGAALFGAAWGGAGFCPGLALVNVGAGGTQALAYVASLVVGLCIADPLLALGAKVSGDSARLSPPILWRSPPRCDS